jgi:hypothetical protein
VSETGAAKRSAPSAEVAVVVVILAVFAAVSLWVINRIQIDYEDLPAYTTVSSQPEGTLALWQMCQELGLHVERFYDSEYDYPPASAMVVLQEDGLSDAAMMFDPYNFDVVEEWVEQGNCLIVATPPLSMLSTAITAKLGPLQYTSYTADPRVCSKFLQAGQTGQTTAIWRVYKPGEQYTLPKNAPPIWKGVGEIETAGAIGAPKLDAAVLLATADPPEPVVLHILKGKGEVFWLLRPELATNNWLGRAGNAQVMWSLLSYASRYGTVYFDEHIHGYQRPHKSSLQLIFTTTGGWLMLAGLASVLIMLLGRAVLPARIVVRPVPPRRDSTEMVLAQADLFRRAHVTGLVGRSLVNSYRRALHAVLRDGQALDEAAFRQTLIQLIAASGGGRPLVAQYAATGGVPGKPAELAEFAQELGSLLEHARQQRGWTGDRRRLQ